MLNPYDKPHLLSQDGLWRAHELGRIVPQIILVKHSCLCFVNWLMLSNLLKVVIQAWRLQILRPDMVQTLESSVLYLVLAMEELSTSIQPTKVFHLAGRILKGKASLSSLSVAKATADIPTTKDLKVVAKWRARLA